MPFKAIVFSQFRMALYMAGDAIFHFYDDIIRGGRASRQLMEYDNGPSPPPPDPREGRRRQRNTDFSNKAYLCMADYQVGRAYFCLPPPP